MHKLRNAIDGHHHPTGYASKVSKLCLLDGFGINNGCNHASRTILFHTLFLLIIID